jgi:hypothetical protein
LEANWEITGYTKIIFRYPFIAVLFFKLSPSKSNKSFGVSPGLFDTSSAICSTFFPISGCGVARSGIEALVLALVGCQRPSSF